MSVCMCHCTNNNMTHHGLWLLGLYKHVVLEHGQLPVKESIKSALRVFLVRGDTVTTYVAIGSKLAVVTLILLPLNGIRL